MYLYNSIYVVLMYILFFTVLLVLYWLYNMNDLQDNMECIDMDMLVEVKEDSPNSRSFINSTASFILNIII